MTPTPEAATLDFALDSNYGEVDLTAGFQPDPHERSVVSGGTVDVGYLDDPACSGYATEAPDYQVNYTSGLTSLLRFYFAGEGDTTLIINAPDQSWNCADDTYVLNPSFDFNEPASGPYDIWIGSYRSGESISGTLYVTELSSNHP